MSEKGLLKKTRETLDEYYELLEKCDNYFNGGGNIGCCQINNMKFDELKEKTKDVAKKLLVLADWL